MPELPSGTVTFLFTDIEGSTQLWEHYPAAMPGALSRHHSILRAAVEEQGGMAFQIIGDGFCVAFAEASKAVRAAVEAQRGLAAEAWAETGPLRVRMGIHTGPAEVEAGEYLPSHTLNKVSRVLSAGHGGQVLISAAALELARWQVPQEVSFRDLGMNSLRGFDQPEHLFQVLAPGLEADFPPLKTKEAPRHNLPEVREPFFGRQRELADLMAKLEQPEYRLVTILGPGGIGKTRLAIETAVHLAGFFSQGAWFVPLAPLSSPDFLAPAVLEALRLSAAGQFDPEERLTEYLHDKELLLVLDNLEHLQPAAAHWAAGLLQAAPRLKLLVTSRARVNVGAEWVYPLEGLGFPSDDGTDGGTGLKALDAQAAPALFRHQAQRVSGFTLEEAEENCVLHICRLVHGMPLALVLAASWVRLLSCAEIAEQIEESLDFLASDQPDLPERQRSIQVVFDYSWQALSADQQAVLRRLSVFRGGFDRQAAAGVAGASLPVLAALLDRSLIHRDPVGRYTIHELLRQFAAARLDDADESGDLHTQHLDYFTRLAEQAEPELVRRDQKRWLERLEAELDNLRAALEWSLKSPDPETAVTGLRLGTAIQQFWLVRGHWREIRRWLYALLDRAGSRVPPELLLRARIVDVSVSIKLGEIATAQEIVDLCLEAGQALGDPKLHAEALLYGSMLAAIQSNEERVKDWYEASLRLAQQVGDLSLVGWCNQGLGRQAVRLRNLEAAHRFYEASLAAFRQAGHIHGVGLTLWAQGDLLELEGDLVGARAVYQEARAIFQDLNDRRGLAWSEIHLGTLNSIEGQLQAAAERFESALAMTREIGEISGEIDALNELGFIALQQGQVGQAREWLRQSLLRNRAYQEKYWASDSLITLAGAVQAEGRLETAARLLGIADALDKFPPRNLQSMIAQVSSAAKAALGEEGYHRLFSEGQATAERLGLETLIGSILEREFSPGAGG